MALNQNLQDAKNREYNKFQQSDGVDITYYTDPLCCWSWAFEPQWRKLQYEFAGMIDVHYRMGGLLPGWKNFHDPINSVSRPLQMGPVWMHASQLSGMPIEHNIWMKDPPASSYPACIAFKCVQLQSPAMAERFLRLLREAVMIKGVNIARPEVLGQLAVDLSKQYPEFDVKRFNSGLVNEDGREAFRHDLTQVRYHNINRFPTLIVRKPQYGSVIVTGYRPYSVLMDALKKVSPNLQKVRTAESAEEYSMHFPGLLPRELQEATAAT